MRAHLPFALRCTGCWPIGCEAGASFSTPFIGSAKCTCRSSSGDAGRRITSRNAGRLRSGQCEPTTQPRKHQSLTQLRVAGRLLGQARAQAGSAAPTATQHSFDFAVVLPAPGAAASQTMLDDQAHPAAPTRTAPPCASPRLALLRQKMKQVRHRHALRSPPVRSPAPRNCCVREQPTLQERRTQRRRTLERSAPAPPGCRSPPPRQWCSWSRTSPPAQPLARPAGHPRRAARPAQPSGTVRHDAGGRGGTLRLSGQYFSSPSCHFLRFWVFWRVYTARYTAASMARNVPRVPR